MDLSMGELIEYQDAIEDMKKVIEEYYEEDFYLVDDFQIFKERIMVCLKKMECLYKKQNHN